MWIAILVAKNLLCQLLYDMQKKNIVHNIWKILKVN